MRASSFARASRIKQGCGKKRGYPVDTREGKWWQAEVTYRDWDLLLVLNVRPRSMSAVPMLMLFGRVAVVVVWIVALAACMLMIMPMAVPVHIHWATFPTMCPAVAMAVAIAMGVSIRGNGCTGGCREHHDHIACCEILLNQLVRWQKPLARSIEKQW
eukprot:2392993-Pleurochrysis_carterae.AAC.1